MTDIFIRTYSKDLDWLAYCLRSIQKFVTGYRNIIIVIPFGQEHLLSHLTTEKVFTCPVYKNDYIGQQITKLTAFKYTDAEHVLFVDSDVCFTKPTDIEYFFRDGKPIIYETPWDFVGDAQCWKEPTERILNSKIDTEKMRRLPIMYRVDTLKNINSEFDVESFSKLDRLSEFNLVGSYAKKYESEKYYFWNTIDNPYLPESSIIQNWSWGGLNDDIKIKLEEVLNA